MPVNCGDKYTPCLFHSPKEKNHSQVPLLFWKEQIADVLMFAMGFDFSAN